MVFLGFGKYVRSDRIFAVEPLAADERGSGARTRVWVEGIADALVASRSERTMALPFHARLDRGDQERVVEALRTALQGV